MELMELLYRIMEELSEAGVPIVFKGAMILNLLMRENNPSSVERGTRDIDGDWIGDAPTMQQMKNVLKIAVKRVDETLDIEIVREYGEKKSAGFKIVNERGEKVASIDLSIRKNDYTKSYISYINGIAITGASINKMLSDKLFAVSGDCVVRRLKDLLDIYVMSYIVEFRVGDIYKIWENTGKIAGDYSAFYSRIDEIRNGYEKMKGIINKPNFDILYQRLDVFLKPFSAGKNNEKLLWEKGSWRY